MATGSQIRSMLERTYDNLNPRAVKWLEDLEQSQGFDRTKNFLNTLAADYDLTPKRGGDNDDFIDIASRVWKNRTGEDVPISDRLSNVRKSLDKMDSGLVPVPGTMPMKAGTSNSTEISKSPFPGAIDIEAKDVTPKGGGSGGGGIPKSPFLTAAAAGGAYAAGSALGVDEDEEKKAAEPRSDEEMRVDIGTSTKTAPAPADAGLGPAALPTTSKVLEGIGSYSPSAAPKQSEFGLDTKGPDYAKVDADRQGLDAQYNDARMEYMRQTNALAEELRGEKDTLRQRQLFEGIAQALGHLAAGYMAKQSGAYVPVMQFQKSDWAGEKQALLNEYSTKERTAASNYAGYKEQLENKGRSIDRAEAQIVRNWEANQKLYETALNTWRANEDSKFRKWQSMIEEAKLKLQEQGQGEDLAFKYANLNVMREYYKGLIDSAKDKNEINAARASLKSATDQEKVLTNFRKSLTGAAKAKTTAETESQFNQAVGYAQQYKDLTGEDLMTSDEIKDADPNPVVERLLGEAAAGAKGGGESRPKTVTQGGYTYTWNEQTGQYE